MGQQNKRHGIQMHGVPVDALQKDQLDFQGFKYDKKALFAKNLTGSILLYKVSNCHLFLSYLIFNIEANKS